MMDRITITKATHKPSGNVKFYRTNQYATECILKSEDKDLNNWKFEPEFVWYPSEPTKFNK